MKQFSFEKLTVWQKAKQFTLDLYKATHDFPSAEKFGLTSQIRRASVSVASNLAEGSARKSRKDQAHYTHIAYSSLMELVCQLMIARDLGYISEETFDQLHEDCQELSRLLNALYDSQFSKSK